MGINTITMMKHFAIILLLLRTGQAYAKNNPNVADSELLEIEEENLRTLFEYEQDDLFLRYATTDGKLISNKST